MHAHLAPKNRMETGGPMGRQFVESCGLLIAIGLLLSHPASAGDRKSSGTEEKMELFPASQRAHAVMFSGQPEQPGRSSAKLFETDSSILASKRLGGHEEKERSGEPKREHKSLTLFR